MYNFRRKSAFLSLLLGFLMLAAAFSSSAASAVDEVFDLVSRVEGGPQLVSRPDGPTEEVVISADGRFVAYQSEASNLVEGDINGIVVDVFVYDRDTDTTQLVTAGGNGESSFPSISADGRFVAFQSAATNFVPGDTNSEVLKIFVYDRDTDTFESLTPNGNDDSFEPTISADGRFVAFRSRAINLVDGDTQVGVSGIFVYDRTTGTTELLTKDGIIAATRHAINADGRFVVFGSTSINLVAGDTNPDFAKIFVYDRNSDSVELLTAGANGDSRRPSITADGRWVAFHSFASNLVEGDPSQGNDVFLFDRDLGVLQQITDDVTGQSSNPRLSSDGRHLVFQSTANLVANDANPSTDIFVYNTDTGETELVTLGADNVSTKPAISADGAIVVFETFASNLVPGDVNRAFDALAYDRVANRFERLHSVEPRFEFAGGDSNSDDPAISADGRFVAYESFASDLVAADNNELEDVFLFNRETGRNELLTPGGNGPSRRPSISADGRLVAFESGATNLSSADVNGVRSDIFVYNSDTGLTQFITQGGNNSSVDPGISADGRFVAFESFANNLVSSDPNGSSPDIFVYDRQTDTTEILTSGGNSPFVLNGTLRASPALSADGRYVAFQSTASNLAPGDTNGFLFDIYLYDRDTDTLELITAGGDNHSTRPSISADGRYVAFESRASNLVANQAANTRVASVDIFVYDTQSRITSLVTSGSNNPSSNPSISADGRFIAFRSSANSLVDVDFGDFISGIFVFDRESNSIRWLTREANRSSEVPSISGDGQFVAFRSFASNLTEDGVGGGNVFVAGGSGPLTANSLVITTQEDTAVSFTVTGSDPDNADPILNFVVVDSPVNGELSGTAPDFVYTPNGDFSGTDSFTFQVNNGANSSLPALVSISVTSTNDAPVATGTAAGATEVTTPEDTPVAITLAGSDIDGDTLTYTVVTAPENGALTGVAPDLVYSPAENYFGTDQFRFSVFDGELTSSVVTINILVGAIEDSPSGFDQSLVTSANSPLAIRLTGIDADNDSLEFLLVDLPSNGSVSGDLPDLVYTPNTDFAGADSLAFTVSDGTSTSAVARVFITVTREGAPSPENRVPVAQSQSVSTQTETPVSISLVGSDDDGDLLVFNLIELPSNGGLSGEAPNFVYTPDTGFSGNDGFTFSVSDGQDTSAVASVSITVAEATVELFSSVLPTSRSVQVGRTATAFASLINAGLADAVGCEIRLPETLSADFFYQTTDPATNEGIGEVNQAVDIPAGTTQAFVFGITPSEEFSATEVALDFRCAGGRNAQSFVGLNTLLLSATSVAVPDLIALAVTSSGNGVMELENGSGFFSIASVNVGSAATITVSADTGDAELPITLSLCQTDPATSECINPTVPALEPVMVEVEEGSTPTFAVFASAAEPIALNPTNSRVFLRFRDESGVVRGATSVAVQNSP